MDLRLELFQKMPIFGGINTDTLHFILERAQMVSVPNGSFFFMENDTSRSMFVLETGKVAVLKMWQGHQYLLCYFQPGDCFGEMELVDLFPRSASALALMDCTAIEIDASILHEVYKRDMKQFAMIHMNMGREISRRLRRTDEQLFKSRIEANMESGQCIFHPERPPPWEIIQSADTQIRPAPDAE